MPVSFVRTPDESLAPDVFHRFSFEYQNGVLFSILSGASATRLDTAIISEAGLSFFVEDEDSCLITASASSGAYQFVEPASKVTSGVFSISTSSILPPMEITVPYETIAGGSATGNLDYTPVQETMSLPGSAFIPLLPDGLAEGTETILVKFGTPSYGKMAADTLSISLTDNPLGLAGPPTRIYLPEPAAGTASYTVPFQLLRPTSANLVVRYRIAALTAGASDAVLTFDSNLTIPAGSTSIPVPVTLLADSLYEPGEQLRVTILALDAVTVNVSTDITIDDYINQGPAADNFNATQGSLLTPDPLRNVFSNDPAGMDAVSTARAPLVGNVVWRNDGTFTYSPPPNFIGVDRMAYFASGPAFFTLATPVVWKWLHPLNGIDPGVSTAGFQTNWKTVGFNDAAWQNGSGLMGYGILGAGTGVALNTNIGTPPNTAPGVRFTAYFRTRFEVASAAPQGINLQFSCDDGVIFYLNGNEIGRYSKAPMGTFATAADTYGLLTSTLHDGNEEVDIITLPLLQAQLVTGTNTLAVSVHNGSSTSSDLGFKLHGFSVIAAGQPTYVTINVADANLPPVVFPDSYNATTGIIDSQLMGGSTYTNDGLLSPEGSPYDPIIEVEISGHPAGPVAFDKDTGHFKMAAPGFFGSTAFGYRIRDKDGWSNTANVNLVIAPRIGFDQWRRGNFPGGSENPAGLPSSDEDQDSLNNLLEYGLGLNPLSADSGISPLKLEWNGTSWELAFTAKRGFGWSTFLKLETSPGLVAGSWVALASLNDLFPELGRIQTGVKVRNEFEPTGNFVNYWVTLPPGFSPQNFFRLRVVLEATPDNP